MTQDDPGICKYGFLEFDEPDTIIIGIEILSLIRDDTNGYWKWIDGKIGDNHFKAKFSTSHFRKEGKYDLNIWYVKKGYLVDC